MNIGVIENGRLMVVEILEWEQLYSSNPIRVKVQSKWLCGIKAG